MATTTLTVKGIEAIKGNGTEFYLWDDRTPGLGLRVNEDGELFFVVQFRVKDTGKRRRLALGKYGQLTLEQARERARAHVSAALEGRDLQAEREAAAKAKAQRLTFDQLADKWIELHVKPKRAAKTLEEYEGMLKRILRPAFGAKIVEEIRRSEVVALHRDLAQKPRTANLAIVLGKACVNFGIGSELISADASNPFEKVEQYKEEGRERFLTDDELARIGAAITELEAEGELSTFAAAAIRLLLLTGARRNEVLHLKWSYVDLDRGALNLPESKTGKRVIQLSEAAIAVLRSVPRVEGNPYVIVGGKEGTHLTVLYKPWQRVLQRAKVDATRVHDLRHSFASFAIADGVSLAILGKLMGHTNPQTTQRYAHLADDVRKRANDVIGAGLARVLNRRAAPKTSSG